MWSIPPKHFAGVPLGLPNAVAQEFHMFVLFFLWLQLLRGVGLFPGPDGGPRLGLLGQSLGQAKALTKLGKNPQGHINYSQRNSLKHCTIDLRTPAGNRPNMPPERHRDWAGLPQGLPKAIA